MYPGAVASSKPECVVTPEETEALGARAIRCRFCGASLTSPDSIDRVVLLPSPYWIELSDYWVCHPDETHVVALEEDIKATASVVLVGEESILLHNSDLVEGRVVDSGLGGNRVDCARCLYPLGYRAATSTPRLVVHDDDPEPVGGYCGVQLNKDRLRALPGTGSVAAGGAAGADPLMRYLLSTRLVMEMIAKAEASSQYRFLVVAEDSNHAPRLQLVLINWHTSLLSNLPLFDSGAPNERRPVAKVRFNQYGATPTMEDEEYVAACPDPSRATQLAPPRAWCGQ